VTSIADYINVLPTPALLMSFAAFPFFSRNVIRLNPVPLT